METLIDFVNTFLNWLSTTLESVLNWSIICVQAIAFLAYFLYTAAIRILIAVGHWLATSLQWLFNVIATLCHWLITSLGIVENGLLYILGLIIVAMIILLSQLIGQIAYLKSENYQLRADRQEQIERENRKAIIHGAIKLIEWFIKQ
ncbi:hypothetical protein WA1_08685 [Scytonema hofmannii PCC 7110]|uniref:Uncharacterized protein n=1 Tax=Scytonema hofmannii PCC 7110 TaxID=128403 RepID=A0A139WS06_9CYAN|nr:hypothetical protein [Scytonema hofmannii]KYC35224.1 hypothetical protein WA1_08685 [Scytonema hofmannii PCC 7110]